MERHNGYAVGSIVLNIIAVGTILFAMFVKGTGGDPFEIGLITSVMLIIAGIFWIFAMGVSITAMIKAARAIPIVALLISVGMLIAMIILFPNLPTL
jgi:hypothetical protein